MQTDWTGLAGGTGFLCFKKRTGGRIIKFGMRAKLATAIVGLIVVVCNGCLLPVPHTRVHILGVDGQVVSALDRRPLGSASVASIDEPTETARCDSNGFFRLRPRRGWHAVYLVSPICESLLPGFDMAYPGREIQVSVPGYVTTNFGVSTNLISGAYLHAGQLLLTPVEQGSNR